MKANTAIAKILKMEGTEFVTGFPNNALQDAVAAEGIRTINFRTEKVAVEAADGFTRVSFGQRIGVCTVMLGPGIEVAFPGVRQAFGDGVPILILPYGDERRRVSTYPNFDTVQIYREITKWADSLTFADRAPEAMRRAFTYLKNGRPGPVLVNIPSDVGGEEFDDALFHYKPSKSFLPAGDPADVREVAKALIAARTPVIRAGQGVLYARAWDQLRELAELLQIPVFTTMNGKSAFPENHPLALGTGGRTRPRMVAHFLDKCDLVFSVGSSCMMEMMTTPIPPGKRIIQTTIDERDINKDYAVEHAIIGDARLVLAQLIEEVKQQLGPQDRKNDQRTAREIDTIKKEWLKEWMPRLTSSEIPLNPYRVYWDMKKVFDASQTIVIHDSGTPRDHLVPFWECVTPGSYIGFGKDHMLGGGLGLALGAKLARPEKTVIYACGEGAFGQNGMDFETAVRERIPIITIVSNNGTLSMAKVVNPVASERYNLNALTGNYSKIAEGLGAYAERVKDPGEIIPALQRAKAVTDSGKPALLEFMTIEELNFSHVVPLP
jgi:thiamine pyrophosphate-dependent acetolactate synthase large subunit-like protein